MISFLDFFRQKVDKTDYFRQKNRHLLMCHGLEYVRRHTGWLKISNLILLFPETPGFH